MNMKLPEKPLVASMEGKVETPQEIYFFQRENGEVLHVNEKGAWSLYMNRNKIIGQYPERLKIIGVGPGHIFQQGLIESRELFKTKGLEAAQARIRQAVSEELEACRGKIKVPRDFDQIDRRGNPVNMSLLR